MLQRIDNSSLLASTNVGSLPDRMARELNDAVQYGALPANPTKGAAAAHLYVTGFSMSDVVEYIDDALALFSEAES